MVSALAKAGDLFGLIPAIDAKKRKGTSVIGGRNFAFDADGPKSAFGNSLLTDAILTDKNFWQTSPVDTKAADRIFEFTEQAILEWNESIGFWDVIFLHTDTTVNPYRWTTAFVNDVFFFCHPAVGILFLNNSTGDRGLLTGSGVPGKPVAIARNNGRLIIIDATNIFWSATDDGFNFVPQTGGPGFQKIASHASGNPIIVASYKKGFLTMTTGGMVNSEFTGDQAVFRHRALQTDITPINSFCVRNTEEDEIIILDRRGFYSTKGGTPEIFAPLFNEFLRIELERGSFLFNSNSRIEWDKTHRFMYLSLSESDITPRYN
jgi:hypothetical protein